jgi:hypothetical protein
MSTAHLYTERCRGPSTRIGLKGGLGHISITGIALWISWCVVSKVRFAAPAQVCRLTYPADVDVLQR